MRGRKTNKCEGCGKEKSLSMCSGELLCSSCAALAGAVSLRPAIVAKMLRKRGKPEEFIGLLVADLGQEWLMQSIQPYLPAQVEVQVENKTLEEIARAIGYTEESGEGLVDAVAQLNAGAKRVFDRSLRFEHILRDVCGELGIGNVEGVDVDSGLLGLKTSLMASIENLKGNQLDPSSRPQGEICGHAVDIDRLYSALGIESGDEAQIDVVLDAIAVMTTALDRFRTRCERYTEEKNVLANQVADLEQQNAVAVQVVAMIKEAIDCPDCLPEELPARIAARLAMNGRLGLDSMPSRGVGSSLDSHLLDLLIEYPVIPRERIAVIREAA